MLTLQKWIIDLAMVSATRLSEIRSSYKITFFFLEVFVSGLSSIYMCPWNNSSFRLAFRITNQFSDTGSFFCE